MFAVDGLNCTLSGQALEHAKKWVEELAPVAKEEFKKLYGYVGFLERFSDGTIYSGALNGDYHNTGEMYFQVSGALSDRFFSELSGKPGIVKVSRVDVKVDVALEMKRFIQVVGLHVSNRLKWSEIKSQGGGHTVYLGSRSSRSFVRIYDKLAERRERGVTVETSVEHITRMEVELKPASGSGRALAAKWSSGDLTPAGLFRSNTLARDVANYMAWKDGDVSQLGYNERREHSADTFAKYLAETYHKRFQTFGASVILDKVLQHLVDVGIE